MYHTNDIINGAVVDRQTGVTGFRKGLGQLLQRDIILHSCLLYTSDKVGGIHQALHRAGIQPCKTAAQQLNTQLVLLQVHVVQGGDLQLTAGRGLDRCV